MLACGLFLLTLWRCHQKLWSWYHLSNLGWGQQRCNYCYSRMPQSNTNSHQETLPGGPRCSLCIWFLSTYLLMLHNKNVTGFLWRDWNRVYYFTLHITLSNILLPRGLTVVLLWTLSFVSGASYTGAQSLRSLIGVAGDGARYFRTSLFFIHWNPVSWLFAIAFSNVAIGGLQKKLMHVLYLLLLIGQCVYTVSSAMFYAAVRFLACYPCDVLAIRWFTRVYR